MSWICACVEKASWQCGRDQNLSYVLTLVHRWQALHQTVTLSALSQNSSAHYQPVQNQSLWSCWQPAGFPLTVLYSLNFWLGNPGTATSGLEIHLTFSSLVKLWDRWLERVTRRTVKRTGTGTQGELIIFKNRAKKEEAVSKWVSRDTTRHLLFFSSSFCQKHSQFNFNCCVVALKLQACVVQVIRPGSDISFYIYNFIRTEKTVSFTQTKQELNTTFTYKNNIPTRICDSFIHSPSTALSYRWSWWGNQTKPESRIYSIMLLFYLLTVSFFVSKLMHLYLTLSMLEYQRKTCLESNISHFRWLPKKIKAGRPTSRPCTKCWCEARLASHWYVWSVRNNPDSLLSYSNSPDLVSLVHLNPTEENPFDIGMLIRLNLFRNTRILSDNI